MDTGTQNGGGILFVAHKDDDKGIIAIERLTEMGFRTLTLITSEPPDEPFVALFGINKPDPRVEEDVKAVPGNSYYLRESSYRLIQVAPIWASATPLLVGVYKTQDRPIRSAVKEKRRTSSTFKGALAEMAKAFSNWAPGLADWVAPWSRSSSPFKPDPSYFGTNIEDRRGAFADWLMRATEVIGVAELKDVLRIHLPTPLFANSSYSGYRRVLFMGCAAFNQPHTDVANALLPSKVTRVQEFTSRLLRDLGPRIQDIRFPLVSEDFMQHEMLANSLHPFMSRSIQMIESRLQKTFPREGLRFQDKFHSRSVAEMQETLKSGAELIRREILEPVLQETGFPIIPVNWTELFGKDLLDEAWRIAIAQEDLVLSIYNERVSMHEWWKTLDQFDSTAGVLRCYANVGIYFALAKYLDQHPETFVVDFEVDYQYWARLAPFIKSEIWHGHEHTIFPVPSNVGQPWAY